MNWMVPALSATGAVLGMQTTVVNLPAAAAREPVPMVSLWVWPGLAEVDVDVDEAGAGDEALGVDDLRWVLFAAAESDGDDFVVV